jgi:monoamine oxidase
LATYDTDILVIGAGAAGLAAVAALRRAGQKVLCVEARGRIGGRIHTLHDPFVPVPVELGAEFIHGRPAETWDIVRADGIQVYDVAGDGLHLRGGKISARDETWEMVGHVLEDMRAAAALGPDRTFAEFLSGTEHAAEAKALATQYVEGFNAADQNVIGIASLAQDSEAADEIDGDASFRILSGYDSVARSLLGSGDRVPALIRFYSIVEAVNWSPRDVRVSLRSALTGERSTVRARQLISTLPLGVLTAREGEPGHIRWEKTPGDAIASAARLAFGMVYRVVMCFREAFWEEMPELADAGFLLSDEDVFPTWWTTLAMRTPVLTGWSAGSHAEPLLGKGREEVIAEALTRLARIVSVSREKLEDLLVTAHYHDWHQDPFARGAYSYVPAGALAAREQLAAPIDRTLYFSGEATELEGHSATVHGAIRTGRRAARQVLEDA